MKPATAPALPVQHGQALTASGERSVFMSGKIFANEAFGSHHPLSISRHSAMVRLCRSLDWLPSNIVAQCPQASEETLLRFHNQDYVRALRQATDSGKVDIKSRELYGIGTMENPLFPGLFERAASTVGGSILAAELALEGRVVFHPAGGTHHGRPDRASGFCYFNDPVFAILTLLDASLDRVMYIDLDAHHGDGVQDAFTDDPRVFTLSVHEENRWPYSGHADDRGGGQSRNLPVPAGFNDCELNHLLDKAVMPLLTKFEPDAIVVTCGADGLQGDPLSRMEISNSALWHAVESLLACVPRAVILGGGGYNPWTVARCWTGLWGRLSGQVLPNELSSGSQIILKQLECDLIDDDEIDPAWITTLADEPNNGPVREAVSNVAQQVLKD